MTEELNYIKAKVASTEEQHLNYYMCGRKNTTGLQGVCESHCLVYWANGLKSKGVINNWEYAFSSEKRAVCFCPLKQAQTCIF